MFENNFIGDLFGMKLISSPLLTRKVDHGIRRRIFPGHEKWERWIEEVPDNNIYFLPGQSSFIGSSLTIDIIKKSMAIVFGSVS